MAGSREEKRPNSQLERAAGQICNSCLLYSGLLLETKSSLTPSKFYSAWPSVKSLSSQWDSPQCPVFSTLLSHPVVWSESSKQWVMPNQAVYLPKTKCGLVVENALTRCGVKLADVPSHVRTAFACVRMAITDRSHTSVDSRQATCTLL